jgi:hypothetical protein
MTMVTHETTNQNLTTEKIQLVDIESEIEQISEMIRQGWFVLGTKLLEVEEQELYEQHRNSSFTQWLNELCKQLGLDASTLWKYLRIVRMVKEIDFPVSEVNLKNVTGLQQIARIYDEKQDAEQATTLIKQLDEKIITIAEIKKIVANLKETPADVQTPSVTDKPQTKNMLKRLWEYVMNCLLLIIPPKAIFSMLPILFVVFYITDIS